MTVEIQIEPLGKESHRRRIGLTLVALGALAALGFSVGQVGTPAWAGTAVSTTGYFSTSYSQWYTNAYIATSTKNAQAWSVIGRHPSANAPAGYMGARGRLFIGGSTSNMSCEGTTQYNSSTSGDEIGFSCYRYTSGTWNSYGVVYGYGSGSYSASYTFNSPNQTS